MEFTQEEKLFHAVVKHAWKNADFKNDLIANPIATIEKFSGTKLSLPKGKTLVVRDQTDNSTIYINIPVKQMADDVELNEEQLEAVAGGVTTPGIIGVGCTPNPFDFIKIGEPSPFDPTPEL